MKSRFDLDKKEELLGDDKRAEHLLNSIEPVTIERWGSDSIAPISAFSLSILGVAEKVENKLDEN
jgi:hypothetical protein